MANLGVEYPFQDPKLLEEWKQKYLEKTGYDNPAKNPEVKEKKIQNSLQKWGYEHPMQHPDIFGRFLKSSLKLKPYTYPSGRKTEVQGYEGYCLDDLLREGIDEKEICNQHELINDVQEMPEIWYNFEGKNRRYFPDIYIPSKNLIIEVKSPYTYKKDESKNIAKGKACKALGFNFEFRVYDKEKLITKIYV